jgi:hypothetical protein
MESVHLKVRQEEAEGILENIEASAIGLPTSGFNSNVVHPLFL